MTDGIYQKRIEILESLLIDATPIERSLYNKKIEQVNARISTSQESEDSEPTIQEHVRYIDSGYKGSYYYRQMLRNPDIDEYTKTWLQSELDARAIALAELEKKMLDMGHVYIPPKFDAEEISRQIAEESLQERIKELEDLSTLKQIWLERHGHDEKIQSEIEGIALEVAALKASKEV
jgi:hypothetical protein